MIWEGKESLWSQLQTINYPRCDEFINCRKLINYNIHSGKSLLKFNMLKWFLSYQKSKYPLAMQLSKTGLNQNLKDRKRLLDNWKMLKARNQETNISLYDY